MRDEFRFTVITISLILIDQFSKLLVLKYFSQFATINPSGGFSIAFKGVNFALITILALIVFVMVLSFLDKKALKTSAFYLVLAGTFSNLLDRIMHPGVVDFINFKIWPSFNFADICITIGVALLILREFQVKRS